MTEKFEPLTKEKRIVELCPHPDHDHMGVYCEEDVKSAVQGLLEEIKDNRVDIEIEEAGIGTVFEPDGRFVRYETIISLIKKWFTDVVEDERGN